MLKKWLFVLSIVLVITLLIPSVNAQTKFTKIYGIVTDSNGNPVVSATVESSDYYNGAQGDIPAGMITTNETGYYELFVPSSGIYQVTFQKTPLMEMRLIGVKGQESILYNLQYRPPHVTIGYITLENENIRFDGVPVKIIWNDGAITTATADSQGVLNLIGVPYGIFGNMTLTYEGRETKNILVSILSGISVLTIPISEELFATPTPAPTQVITTTPYLNASPQASATPNFTAISTIIAIAGVLCISNWCRQVR